MKNIFWPLILTAWFISGCSREGGDGKTRYNISAEFDYTEKYFDCRMNVRWTNNSLSTVDSLPFLFNGSPEDGLVKQVRVNGKAAPFTYMDEDAGVNGFYVRVPAVRPGGRVAVEIDFRTYEDDYFRDNLLFYDDDFPVIPYCGTKGFIISCRQHADYEVTVTVPDSYHIAPTGVVSFEVTENGRKTYTTWARDVPWYGVVLLWKEIRFMDSEAAGVGIRTFYFPQDSLWAPKLTAYTADIIEFYTGELGFFPSPVVSIIPGYHLPYGGWPVCPNVVGIHMGLDLKPEDHARWITAHELAHQYWGFNYTISPTDYPEWLAIALGIYTDRIYSRFARVDMDYDEDFYEDYIEAVEEGVNTIIMRPVAELDEEGIDWNNIIVHGKGWVAIRMLENLLGEDVFRNAYDLYFERSGGRNLDVEEFRRACEEAAGKKYGYLSGFFHTWLHTDDYLQYSVKDVRYEGSAEEGMIYFVLEKEGAAAAEAIDIAYYDESGGILVKAYPTGGESLTVEETITFRPVRIETDPMGKLPLINRSRASAEVP